MKYFLLILVTAFNLNSFSQFCGTQEPTAEEYAYTKNVISNIILTKTTGLTCVPIRPHIVTQTNGTGGISFLDLNLALAQVNSVFYDVGLEFYFCGASPDNINNSTYYNFNTINENNMANTGNEVSNAINMYFVNEISINGSGLAYGYAKFPNNNIASTRIVIQNNAALNSKTIVHELGHHFSLYHTFQNTENGNNVGGAEHVARTGSNSNCSYSGDLLCDTEADPGFTGSNLSDCVYIGTNTDIYGTTYKPDISNIMSYFPNSCSDERIYSTDQANRILQGRASRESFSSFTMNCQSPFISAPTNFTASFINNNVVLNWTDNANNEMGYFIERSEVSATSGFRPFKGFATDQNATSFTDITIKTHTTYYYRIKATNKDCSSYSNIDSVTIDEENCLASSLSTTDGHISNFKFNTINNTSSASNYSFYNNISTDLNFDVNINYNATIVSSHYQDTFSIWIDLNHDGDFFDLNEEVVKLSGNSPHIGYFSLPENAVEGKTKMRIRIHANDEVNSPCGKTERGEVEDYYVNIIPRECDLFLIQKGAQTNCDESTNTYDQVLTINYDNTNPEDSIIINGQYFKKTGTPQVVNLTGLNGAISPLTIDASFMLIPSCNLILQDFMTSPSNCTGVGIEELNNNFSDLTIFPSLVSDKLTIRFKSIQKNNIEISLYNITGQKVEILSKRDLKTNEIFNESYELNIPKGVYYIKLRANDSDYSQKIIRV